VVGLPGIELLKEVGGKLGIFSDEGVKLMVGRGRGVDGGVRVARHWLMMEDAEGVTAEGGVGLTVLKWGLLLVLAASSRFLCGSRRC